MTPWDVHTVEQYNECAKRLDTLADKVREHNKKSEKTADEKAVEVRP